VSRPIRIRIVSDTGCGSGRDEAAGGERVRVEGARAAALAGGRRRIALAGAVMSLAFAGLGLRIGVLAAGADPGLATARLMEAARPEIEEGDAPYTDGLGFTAGSRPEILDRNGRILAANLPVRRVAIDGRRVWDAEETARLVADAVGGVDEARLRERLAARRYAPIRRDLTPRAADAIMEFGLPGVRIIDGERRFYPNRDLAAHVVGHVDADGAGVMGLEKWLDDAPVAGAVASSIDLAVQRAVETELADAVGRFSANAGWAVVMDARSGEVYALANAPDFDPNAPGDAPADARRNRAVLDLYELGSAFKAITAAAAIEAGRADEETEYDARKPLLVADRAVRDYHPENRVMTLTEVVQHSSNIGSASAALDLGPKRMKSFLDRLGMARPVETELPLRRTPLQPAKWGPVELATVSYGHGLSVTPLHLVKAYAPIVNGGCAVEPTFVRAEAEPTCRRVLKRETSLAMRRILKAVMDPESGTGSKAQAEGYFVIGKTATADKPADGGYDRGRLLSSFIGAFPGHDPRFIVLVSLDEPKGLKETYGYATAGWTAAPVVAKIVERIAPQLGVRPVEEGEAMMAFMGMGEETAWAAADVPEALQ